jgi:hypothetical protein
MATHTNPAVAMGATSTKAKAKAAPWMPNRGVIGTVMVMAHVIYSSLSLSSIKSSPVAFTQLVMASGITMAYLRVVLSYQWLYTILLSFSVAATTIVVMCAWHVRWLLVMMWRFRFITWVYAHMTSYCLLLDDCSVLNVDTVDGVT